MIMAQTRQQDWFSEVDLYLFGEGTHYRIYEQLGAHLTERDGKSGVYFAVWAPNAQNVSLVGDFNNWQAEHTNMKRNNMGIWEIFMPGMKEGDKYKYAVKNHHGYNCFKTDPHGFEQEIRPATASIVRDISYTWGDRTWLTQRHQNHSYEKPISVYEVHLGSWMHENIENPPENGVIVPVPDKQGARFLTYRELADRLIPYVKDMGYTHIELMPITEHPFDGSWGYQVVGFFAPTSRYGSPQDFMYFVDRAHQEGIGILIDWVPGHFPKDEHGLARFDGTHLYEYSDWRKGEHLEWGTLVFNYERNEVRNFLIASALFWLEKYHIDGIRVDAVASMLYLDYEREVWVRNQYGGRENIEGIDFIRQLNNAIKENYPGVLTIAEESTTWENVSQPTKYGGLGFDYKWNMGWMNDTLKYFLAHPHDRPNFHNKLTFSMWYAFTEHFMLSLSHDEVVHGKGHLWQKMPGDEWQQMANMRLLFGYMFAHPGKKTLFMGMELGQRREWKYFLDLDWWLLDWQPHRQLQQLVKDLHTLYRSQPALYTDDFSHDGFQWIDCHDAGRSMLTFMRRDKNTHEVLVVVCNFKPDVYYHYWLGVNEAGTYEEIMNTDDLKYGGSGVVNQKVKTKDWNHCPWPYALEITVPPLSMTMFKKVQ